jgi:hypothetical protein
MLASELNPERDSLALVKAAEGFASFPVWEGNEQHAAQSKHLRELLSHNIIVSGWIRQPMLEQPVESVIDDMRERVERFENNKHLRYTQNHNFILSI